MVLTQVMLVPEMFCTQATNSSDEPTSFALLCLYFCFCTVLGVSHAEFKCIARMGVMC